MFNWRKAAKELADAREVLRQMDKIVDSLRAENEILRADLRLVNWVVNKRDRTEDKVTIRTERAP